MADEPDHKKTLDSLSTHLAILESALSPILSKPSLEEGLSTLDLLQRAKMEVLVGYVIHDLIWIYLKTRGITPSEHPVSAEIDRIKTYFQKIKSIESKDEPRMKLDKGAAGRFIKHAIGSQSVSDAGAGASTSAAVDEEAFRKAADDLLEDSDDEDEEAEAQKVVEKVDDVKGKGKSKRPKVDAFAGYDNQDALQTNAKPEKFNLEGKKKKSKRKRTDEDGKGGKAETDAAGEGGVEQKKKKKKKRKDGEMKERSGER